MDVCGGDLNVVRASAVSGNDGVWIKIIDARKNALKQAALIGFDTLFLLLLHRLTLQSAVGAVSRRIQLEGRALVCPYAEIGMDVDKPHQLEIVGAISAACPSPDAPRDMDRTTCPPGMKISQAAGLAERPEAAHNLAEHPGTFGRFVVLGFRIGCPVGFFERCLEISSILDADRRPGHALLVF